MQVNDYTNVFVAYAALVLILSMREYSEAQ